MLRHRQLRRPQPRSAISHQASRRRGSRQPLPARFETVGAHSVHAFPARAEIWLFAQCWRGARTPAHRVATKVDPRLRTALVPVTTKAPQHGAFECAEEDSNLHPLSVDQALNLVTRVSDPSYASVASRTSGDRDASDVMDAWMLPLMLPRGATTWGIREVPGLRPAHRISPRGRFGQPAAHRKV